MGKTIAMVVLVVGLFATVGCTNMSKTQQGALSGGAIGAGAGAGIAAISGGYVGVGAAIGGALGGVAGALYGHDQEMKSKKKSN